MKRDNLTVVLGKFAGELNFRIDLQQVYDELLIHPDYPSLLAVSDGCKILVLIKVLTALIEINCQMSPALSVLAPT